MLIRSTPTKVSLQSMLNFSWCRHRIRFEDRLHRHDESRRAEAALLGVESCKGGGDGVELIAGDQRFGGANGSVLCFYGQHAAGVDRLVIKHNGAGATGAAVANALAARNIHVIA